MDVQGAELMALEGASDILTRTRLIVTEGQFIPLYKGSSLIGEVNDFLKEKGFILLGNLENPSGASFGDFLFFNERLHLQSAL